MFAGRLTMSEGSTIENLETGLFEVRTNVHSQPRHLRPAEFPECRHIPDSLRTITHLGELSSSAAPEFINTGLVDVPDALVSIAGGSTSSEFRLGSNTTVHF
jgi:hypothetical protein